MTPRRVCVCSVALVTAVTAGCGGGGGSTETATTTTGPPRPPMALIQARGSELVAGGRPFVAFGFNYGGPSGGDQRLFSFDHAGPNRMRRYIDGMRKARDLGANTLRIYLQLFDFIKRTDGRVEPRKRALANLGRVLDAAERLGLYLDVTGNIVWVPGSAPHWYDRLLFPARWLVQARFWDLVSRVTASSPAVLCYELTSEPIIAAHAPSWYGGRLGGLNFVQLIVRNAGRSDTSALAQQWIRALSGAIRRNDPRHLIGLGLLPSTTGPFAPENVAGLLNVVLPHLYPKNGTAAQAVHTVRAFAAPGKPVILGETFMLQDDARTQKRFLLGSRRYLSGALSFFRPFGSQRRLSKATTFRYKVNVREFLSVRPRLLATREGF